VNRKRSWVAGALVAIAVVWASRGFASGEGPASSRGGEDAVGIIRADGAVFLAFEKVKMEQLREFVEKGDQESALRLEERLHKEEVRFLERAIWACNQERSLQSAAFSMMAYLDNFKGMPPHETLRSKVASHFGSPEVYALAMQTVGQPPGQRPGANSSGAVAQFSGDTRFLGPAGADPHNAQFAGGPPPGAPGEAPFAGDPRLAGPGGVDPRFAGPGGDPHEAQLAGAPGAPGADPRFGGPGGEPPPGAAGFGLPPGAQPLGAPPFPGAPGGHEEP
jgi:hypothetical protein